MKNKSVRGSVRRHKQRPSLRHLKFKALSQAIAVATAGLQASAALGACPGSQTDARTTNCILTSGDAVTVTNTGSIIVANDNAITLTGAGAKTVTNSGAIRGTPFGIGTALGSSGTLNVTNNATGDIRGQNAGILIDAPYTLDIDNAGTIRAIDDDGSFGSAAGIAIFGSFNESSSIVNSGTVSASADGTSSGASAAGIYITGVLAGTINNTGTIRATSTAAPAGTSASGFFFGTAYAAGIAVESALLSSGSITNSGTITASATGASAAAQAYGIYIGSGTGEGGGFSTSVLGSITNSGTISATANGDFDGSATGIYVEEDLVGAAAVLTNSGTITVTATGNGQRSAEAAGIYIDGSLLDGASVVNTASGVITVTATGDTAEATGILIDNTIGVGSSLTNAGTITVTATGTTESATAYGIYVDDDLEGTLTNSGTITATATGASTAEAYGIYISSTVTATGNLTNSGTIDVTAQGASEATAAGIKVEESLEGTLLNSGTITVLAEGSSSAEAYGIFVSSTIAAGATLTNSGSIDVTANATSSGDATAAGIYASFTVDGSILNSGTITANANGGFDGGEGFAAAAGIFASSMTDGSSLVNSGTITAIADGSRSLAGGILVGSAFAGSTITNSGTINVTSNGAGGSEFGVSSAGGVGIGIGFLEDGATLSNSGTISANTAAGPGTGWAVLILSGGSSEGELALMTNSGTLRGNVLMSGTSLTNTGLLSIPVSTGASFDSSFIGGNYIQSGQGVLEIGAFSTSLYGRLVVAGTADISANGRLAVNVSANDMLVSAGVLDNVVTAGNLITGNNMTVTDNSALWDFTAVNDGENGIDLVISGGIRVTDAVTANGPRWALGAAGSLDAIVAGGEAGGDMATVIANLSTLPQSAQLAGAAAQMVPVMVARGVQQANLALSGLSSLVGTRMDTLRAGLVDPASRDQNLWVRMYGSTGEQDDEGEFSAYETESYGFVIGYDRNLDSGWNVGGAVGYSQPNIESESVLIDDEIDSDSYHAALYGYRDVGNNTFVDLTAMVGMSQNDSRRHIMFAGINRTAQGDYDSWYSRLSASLGHSIPLADGLTLTPVVSLAYTQVEDDSYTETGAAALNLNVDENDVESLLVGIDARLGYQMSESTLITLHAGYAYDTLTDEAGVSASFVGGGPVFQTAGLEPDGNILRGGVSADVVATDTMELHLQYEYENRDEFENNLLTATFRWKI